MEVAMTERTSLMTLLEEKMMDVMNEDSLDEKTSRMIERMTILRVATKHINLWIRQLEMKRMEMCELAGLMGFDAIKKEIETEKSLEAWAKR